MQLPMPGPSPAEQETARSMGKLSATQSEIYRDVFNDAAANLIADIFAESVEEQKRKAGALWSMAHLGAGAGDATGGPFVG